MSWQVLLCTISSNPQNDSAEQALSLPSVSLCGRVGRWFRGRMCIRIGSFQDLSETEKMPAGVANQVNVYFSPCVCVCVCVCVLAMSLLVKTTRMSQKQLVQDKHWLGHMFTID